MAPKSSKKTTVATNLFSDTAPAVKLAPIDYEEVQKDELNVLESIFSDDFEDVATQGAWKKTTDRNFRLTVRSSDRVLSVVLAVRFTATYPRSPPILNIVSGLEDLHDRTVARIQNVLEKKPTHMLGEPMIHDICLDIEDALQDASTARQRNTLPSLDQERATAQETAAQLAKQAEEAEARMKSEAEAEARRELDRKVKEESLRLEKRKSRRSLNQPPEVQVSAQQTLFFQTARITVDGVPREFTEVAMIGSLVNGETKESIILGRPLCVASRGDVPVVAVKRRLAKKSNAVARNVESLMAKVAQLQHPNLLNVFAARVTILSETEFELLLCREYADRGHLYDLLSMSTLHRPKAQHFTRELLEGLGYLHSHGIIHGYLNVRSTYLTSGPTPSPKLSNFGLSLLDLQDATMPKEWRPPADILDSKAADIWQLGVVVAQMFLGVETPDEYESPKALREREDLSDPMVVFLDKVFAAKKDGSSCFELGLGELLRTDEPVLQMRMAPRLERRSSFGHQSPFWRSRHNSSTMPEAVSESTYAKNFNELAKLGRGGFGAVVKALHKTDQGVYAVKKILVKGPAMDRALAEVALLKQVTHPYVVRYINSWLEEDVSNAIQDDSDSVAGSGSEEDTGQVEFGYSASYSATGGLDFISNDPAHMDFGDDEDDDRGNDGFVFGNSDSEDDSADVNGTSTISGAKSTKSQTRARRTNSLRPPRVLFIQMELCVGSTLSSLIERGIPEDDSWRLIRQITSGLAAVHAKGIVHRDLKPQNIFVDENGNPKLGDFGLATITPSSDPDAQSGSNSKSPDDGDSDPIGTALYVAPEMRSGSSAKQQSEKVDMYSLGIMYFEMCQRFGTKMERIEEVLKIRQKVHSLPETFLPQGEKAKQGDIISRLISHKADERPRSVDLLQELPVHLEDETTRRVMDELKDRNSAVYRHFMAELFSYDSSGAQRAQGTVWDTQAVTMEEKALSVRLRNIVRGVLETIFRRHGAEEIRRDFIFPSAVQTHYPTTPNVMQLIDGSGNLLQLPYDLILPYARQLARQKAATRCTFTFSGAYRNVGGPPKASVEADFDIVNNKDDEDDTALNDAEALKVVDEALTELPQFVVAKATFLLSHGLLIDAILDACRVPLEKQLSVKNALELVGYQSNTRGDSTWTKVHKELLNMQLMGTAVDALKKYDWTLPPTKAFEQLSKLMANADSHAQARCNTALDELRRIVQCTEQFEVGRKVVISPLSCHNAKFYATGFIFTAAVPGKNGKLPLASGGRYDSLVEAQYSPERDLRQGAVGVQIGVDPIVRLLINSGIGKKSDFYKGPKQDQQLAKRCDVLLVTNGTEEVRKVALGLLNKLWASDIKAELSRDHKSYESQEYLLIAHLKHETSTTVALTNNTNGETIEVNIWSLVNHIQQELRDMVNSRTRIPLLRHNSSHQYGDEHKVDDVEVLRAERGSKKFNRDEVVHSVRRDWEEKLDLLKEAPKVAVDARDHVLVLVAATKLSDPETWRQAIQSGRSDERALMRLLQEKLMTHREAGTRYIGVYSLLSKKGILYDMAA